MTVLKQRAAKRGGMTKQMIADRLKVAETEIKEAKNYDYQVMNYDGRLPETIDNVAKIEVAECQGCGTCASECPAKAIQLKHSTDAQILAKCEALTVTLH